MAFCVFYNGYNSYFWGMMKQFAAVLLGSILLFSCSSGGSKPVAAAAKDETAKPPQRFFSVTDFLKGEIKNISTKGVNPLRLVTANGRTDSAWLKLEELDTVLGEFTTPVIDSTNLTSLFTETKFGDNTLNTFTFTYDPAGKLPDTMQLVHWDVYINPETNTVKKVYMVKHKKENNGTKTLQLTWQTGKWCKTITLAEKPDGKTGIEKEETVLWDFSNR
jgi:hypothetical protein